MESVERKDFDRIEIILRQKYMLAEVMMTDSSMGPKLNELITEIERLYAELMILAPKAYSQEDLNDQGHPLLQCVVQSQLEFKGRATEWLLSAEKAPSITTSSNMTRSSRSSTKRREAYVQAQKARLEAQQVAESARERAELEAREAENRAALQTREAERKAELAELELRAWDEQLPTPHIENVAVNPTTKHIPIAAEVGAMPRHDAHKELMLRPLPNGDDAYQTPPRKRTEPAVLNYRQMNADVTLPPRPEIMKFNGDPLDYHEFVRKFETHIEQHVKSETTRLIYLLQQCEPEVRRQLSHYTKDALSGYRLAREQLFQLYGRPHITSKACSKLLAKTPVVGERDPAGLLKLDILLQRCKSALADVGEYAGINSLHCLLPIINKLPESLQTKWIEWSVCVAEEKCRDAGFLDLVAFVARQSKIYNSLYGESLYSREPGRYRKAAAFNTLHEITEQLPTMCDLCDKKHALPQCFKFKKMNGRERRELASVKGLCFRCLQRGHRVAECPSAECCGECKSTYHHSLLHYRFTKVPKPDKTDDQAKAATSCSSILFESPQSYHTEEYKAKGVYMCVVPVNVRYKNREVRTYAFLDSGSSATLCNSTLTSALGITGTPKQISLTTLCAESTYNGITTDLTVCSLDGETEVEIQNVVSVDHIPVRPNILPRRNVLDKMNHLKGIEFPQVDGGTVTLLIGIDVPEALWVQKVLKGKRDEPVAWKTPFGWSLMGPSLSPCSSTTIQNNLTTTSDALSRQINRLWNTDFGDSTSVLASPTSREDRIAHELMKKSVSMVNGHFQLPLPKKPCARELPDNRVMAQKRADGLKRRLLKNDELHVKYTDAVQSYIEKGYAREVPATEIHASRKRWFIPHHPVVHPRKPGKVRVVFDCAAKHNGLSLNDVLMQGPDLTNSLIGVLTRFRQNQIALVADVEGMFHQVRVDPRDTDMLSFLWWKGGNLQDNPTVYQMLVHLFGATSSPSCAAFCLKECARVYGDDYDDLAANVVKNNFYVDDCLVSVENIEKATKLVTDLRELLARAGFRLTKWLSNNAEVLKTIPEKERAKNASSLNIDACLDERVLGVQWRVQSDEFSFTVTPQKKPVTRRGILSVVSSIYDPLGFAAPVLIKGRLLWQRLCKRGLNWDEKVSQEEENEWINWLEDLPGLEQVRVQRCFKPPSLGKVIHTELHHFADASTVAYGAVSYLRFIDIKGNIHCSFLIGKARVAPMSTMSIPRLELTAAVLAVRHDQLARRELNLTSCQSTFWTDSTAVLQTIYNCKKRFPTFVANRIAEIERYADINRWKFVPTELNPADDATRGLTTKLLTQSGRWINGPDFLWQAESKWPVCPVSLPKVPDEFLPLKRQNANVNLLTTDEMVTEFSTDRLINHFSSWYRLKKAAAWLSRYKMFLLQKIRNVCPPVSHLTASLSVKELESAEIELIKYEQRKHFGSTISILDSKRQIKKDDCIRVLSKLNPLLRNGVLRVGGRIDKAPVEYDAKHPIILPCYSHVTNLIIDEYHQSVGHSGYGHTLSALRGRFWILKIGVAVRRVLTKCLPCKRRSAVPGCQIMAELPSGRLQAGEPAFSHVGVDYFGPFSVKQNRSEIKRYGCIFTCLTIRAIHIEMANDLSADSFLNALRRFIGRRGKPKQIYSDNGTNFVGAEKILRSSLALWNREQIAEHLRQRAIAWSFNPPAASHMGGVWERMIRSVRRLLSSMHSTKGLFTDEALNTLFVEVESIVNSRPLVPVIIDPHSDEPITPNHLLLLRDSPNEAPGLFDEKASYARRRWVQVQHMANIFWKRWVSEFLPNLIKRQKWYSKRSNFEINDIVLLVDESQPRSKWVLGRVMDTYADKHGVVRTVLVKTPNSLVKRPIAKLCLIVDSEDS